VEREQAVVAHAREGLLELAEALAQEAECRVPVRLVEDGCGEPGRVLELELADRWLLSDRPAGERPGGVTVRVGDDEQERLASVPARVRQSSRSACARGRAVARASATSARNESPRPRHQHSGVSPGGGASTSHVRASRSGRKSSGTGLFWT
jgi:hypothetical protein